MKKHECWNKYLIDFQELLLKSVSLEDKYKETRVGVRLRLPGTKERINNKRKLNKQQKACVEPDLQFGASKFCKTPKEFKWFLVIIPRWLIGHPLHQPATFRSFLPVTLRPHWRNIYVSKLVEIGFSNAKGNPFLNLKHYWMLGTLHLAKLIFKTCCIPLIFWGITKGFNCYPQKSWQNLQRCLSCSPKIHFSQLMRWIWTKALNCVCLVNVSEHAFAHLIVKHCIILRVFPPLNHTKSLLIKHVWVFHTLVVAVSTSAL